jgi:hypothetical protein
MLTEDIYIIKISEMAAFTSKNASYDKGKEELTFTVENALQEAFRLVWEDVKVFTLVEGTNETITSSLHIIEEFGTEEQALNRIEELKLEYDPPELGSKDGKKI